MCWYWSFLKRCVNVKLVTDFRLDKLYDIYIIIIEMFQRSALDMTI